MWKLKVQLFVLLGGLLFIAGSAFADVPTNLIVNRGGYEWVWASPCSPLLSECSNGLDLSNGWSLPTTNQWQSSFSGAQDLFSAFNLPGGGQLCAASYFDSGLNECDSDDVYYDQSYWGFVWGAPSGISNPDAFGYDGATFDYSETFLVRAPAAPAVPEPGSMLLLGSGVAGMVQAIRRKLDR